MLSPVLDALLIFGVGYACGPRCYPWGLKQAWWLCSDLSRLDWCVALLNHVQHPDAIERISTKSAGGAAIRHNAQRPQPMRVGHLDPAREHARGQVAIILRVRKGDIRANADGGAKGLDHVRRQGISQLAWRLDHGTREDLCGLPFCAPASA